MADEAIIDAAVDTDIDALDTSAVDTDQTDAITDADAATDTDAAQTQEPAGAAQTWKQVKEALKDKPELHRQVKKALHFLEDANKRLPDGIGKAVERLELLNQLDDNPDDPEYVPGSATIEEVISNTVAERSFWRDFDSAFQQGDGRVINQMIEANPGSFQKLIPEAMDRYSELNPEGFSTYICRSVSGFLDGAQIPLQLALLARVLPEKSDDPGLQTVIDAFGSIKKVVDEIQSAAARKIEPKNATAVDPAKTQNGNRPSLEDREIVVTDNEWVSRNRGWSDNYASEEAMKHAGKTRFTPAEVSSIQKFIRQEVKSRLEADPSYANKMKGFVKAKNETAWKMARESKLKNIIGGSNGAAARAVADVLAKRKAAGAKKPATNAATKPGQTQNQSANQGSGKNFEWISDSPSRLGLKVDFRRGGMMGKDKDGNESAFVVGRSIPVKWRKK